MTKKTKQFIRKAKKNYGDRYDYSKVKYVNDEHPVIIICSNHGEFTQLPIKHLNEHFGCNTCALEEPKYECTRCEETDYLISNGYKCDNCENIYCADCRDEVLYELTNNDRQTLCVDCADDNFIAAVEKEIRDDEEICNDFNNLQMTKDDRKKEIQAALSNVGLKLRADSKLCRGFIEFNSGDLDEIVSRMCEMKYLYEYCNMKKELTKVEILQAEIYEAGYIPDWSVFEEAEMNILNSIDGNYPDVWPWLM